MAASADAKEPVIGLYGLAVMGQNLALNIAEKGFPIAVCNRSEAKVSRSREHWRLRPLVDSKSACRVDQMALIHYV